MEIEDEVRIRAPRQRVWDALNDTASLKRAIPGCQSVDRLSATEIDAVVTAKVGPVKANFSGRVTLSDLDPPNGYTISGEGKGGAAGFAKGVATVRLREESGETVLHYAAKATVGGKLAQLGSRLIDGVAKKLADEFFTAFREILAEAPAAMPEAEKAPPPAPVVEARRGISPWVWIPALIAAVTAVVWLLTAD